MIINPVRCKFSRHIDIRRYFVRDMVSAGVIKLEPLRTHLMVADALTKSLPAPAHIKHREIVLGHVPFSFAARTLRRSVGGVDDPSLSLSFPAVTREFCKGLGPVTLNINTQHTQGEFLDRNFIKVHPIFFQIVVCKGESDKGNFVVRDNGPIALILRNKEGLKALQRR